MSKFTAHGTKRKAAFGLMGLAAFLLGVGCSSMSKNSAGGGSGSGSEPGVIGDAGDDSGLDSGLDSKGALVESAKSSSSLQQKYQTLAQAVRSGRANAIIDEASKILGENQHDPVALNALALYHFRKGRIGAAKLLINRAFEKNQPTAGLYNNLGVILLEEGDQAGALENFKKALRIDDHHPEALGNLGSLYVQGGDYSKALPLLEQSYKQNRGNAAIANNYAIALRASKSFDRAASVYEDLIKQNSRNVEALLNYAILMIDYMNKPKDGLALVYKVKFLETDRKDVLVRANALEKKAKSELK